MVVGSSPTGGDFPATTGVCVRWESGVAEKLREPGIEPGPTPWQGAILPLDHSRLAVAEGEEADVPKWLRGSPAKRVCSACAGSNPAVCVLLRAGGIREASKQSTPTRIRTEDLRRVEATS